MKKPKRGGDRYTSREKARLYLDRLQLQHNPQYKSDPVTLLGDTAVAQYRQLQALGQLSTDLVRSTTTLTRTTSSSQLQYRHPEYEKLPAAYPEPVIPTYAELLRAAVPVNGYLIFTGSTTERLSIPFNGVANLLVVTGSGWPASDSNYDCHYTEGRVRLHVEQGLGIESQHTGRQSLAVASGIYEIEVRAYEDPGAGPDIVIRITPKQDLDVSVVFPSK
jgi:hypothetical protein